MNSEPTTKTIFIATGISFSIAVAILIVAVLPAEFGIDPLGAGKRLGLLDLYAAGSELVSSRPQTKNYLSHDIDIPLSPFESMEFKYRLESGAGMVYTWKGPSGEVLFDFHGEADDAEPGEASFYETGRKRYSSGTFVAPFTGNHGWFWENRGAKSSSYV
ncbi:MAG: hypothetical protein Ct9H300mP8_07020 [Gammaproteobacteria bacterium]|nr:MAG: hypothetical protein Ct9H300mP8_07020 [Gammaproteobacteria bacterium]